MPLFPMRKTLLALFVLFGSREVVTSQVPARPITVCEVFQNLEAYRGKVIEVRGAWNGEELWGDCAETSFGVGMWPAIALHPSRAQEFNKQAATAKRLSQKRGTRPIVTVVGRIDVPDLAELGPGESYVYGANIEPTQIKNISSEKIVPINKDQPMNVCDALQHREAYNGKFVEIRGRFYGNSIGDKCEPLRTERFEWPAIIEIAFPELSIEELDPPATWSVDPNWYNKKAAEASRKGANSNGSRASKEILQFDDPAYGPSLYEYLGIEDQSPMATLVGRFDARDIDLKSELFNGRFGYGHLDSLPARLVIVDVRDIVPVSVAKPSR